MSCDPKCRECDVETALTIVGEPSLPEGWGRGIRFLWTPEARRHEYEMRFDSAFAFPRVHWSRLAEGYELRRESAVKTVARVWPSAQSESAWFIWAFPAGADLSSVREVVTNGGSTSRLYGSRLSGRPFLGETAFSPNYDPLSFAGQTRKRTSGGGGLYANQIEQCQSGPVGPAVPCHRNPYLSQALAQQEKEKQCLTEATKTIKEIQQHLRRSRQVTASSRVVMTSRA